MKYRVKALALAISLGLALVVTGGCSSDDAASSSAAVPVVLESDGSVNVVALQAELVPYPNEDLSDFEKESLAYIREEEKLARDVYFVLNTFWGSELPYFRTVETHEETHMAAVLVLLDRYKLPDPAAGKDVGEFTDPTIAALYAQLASAGSISLEEALLAGVEIEEKDISDLQGALDYVDNKDIRMVYGILLKGSCYHLKVFTNALAEKGVSYESPYLRNCV